MDFKPVIFGGFVNGYSLARTFYETYKISSHIVDIEKSISYYSKFCDYSIVSDPRKDIQNFISEVKEIGLSIKKNNKIPILLATNDIWLIPLAKCKSELEAIYLYSFSDWDIINKLINKNHLYKLSDFLNIPYPKTLVCTNKNTEINDLTPPLIVKPSNVVEYLSFFPNTKRNNIFEKEEDAVDFINYVYNKGYQDKFIIQEFIPGGVENLYTCTSYSNKKGLLKGASVGYKLSQYPDEAGTITSGIIDYKQIVVDFTKILLENQKFFGIANTEFKFDTRDKKFKLIEVNARPGMWNYSSLKSGLNLISLLIDDIIYNKNISLTLGKNQILWTRIKIKDLLKKMNNQKNQKIIFRLIDENKIINPLKNFDENFIFKSHIFTKNIKANILNKLEFCLNKWRKHK